MKHLLATGIFLLCTLATFSQNIKNSSVHFEVDQHFLSQEAKSTLDAIIEDVKYYHIDAIQLSAHTDHDASDQYNIALSERRATAVSEYLSSNGISVSKMNKSWHGEDRPKASNATKQGKQLNRRVDLRIEYRPYENPEQVLADLRDDPQIFQLNSDGPITIEGEEGIKIEIPVDAFVDSRGRPVPNHKVNIELEEFTSMGESFINQLSTESDGEMLETGGMLRVDAYANNEKLKLDKDKQISISIPNTALQAGMTVFTGNRRADGVMDWTNTGESFMGSDILTEGTPLPLDTIPFLNYINYDLEYARNYKLALEIEYPEKPERPRLPSEPRYPNRPDPSTVYSGLAKWLFSDAKKNRKADKIFDERIERYSKRLARYNRQVESYSAKEKAYNNAMADYELRVDNIKEEINTHLAFLTAKYNEVKSLYDQKRLNLAIKQIAGLIRSGRLRTTTPEDVLQRYATVTVKDQMYNDLVRLSYHINFYSYLGQFEPDYIRKHFVYKGKVMVNRMKYKGFNYRQHSDLLGHLYTNVKYEAMMTGEEVPTLIQVAVTQKKEADRAAGITPLSEFDQTYNAVTSKMGWINCDRFSRVRLNRMVNVSMMSVIGARMMVYVKKFKSLMNANSGVARVPKGTRIKAIFMTTIDGRPHLSIDEIKATGNIGIQPDYKPMTLEEIKKVMKEI